MSENNPTVRSSVAQAAYPGFTWKTGKLLGATGLIAALNQS